MNNIGFLTVRGRVCLQRPCSTGGVDKRPGIFRRIWDSWIPIPTGVGLTLLGVLKLRRMERERKKDLHEELWEIKFYKKMPLRGLSRGAGKMAELQIPHVLRTPLFATYSRLFGVNVTEMSKSYETYGCFGDFFTRALRDGVRPLSDSTIVSPADGRVMTSTKVHSFQIEQVKGATYSIKEFLGKLTWKTNNSDKETFEEYKRELLSDPRNELYQCIIYLSPGDYHRFHSPVDLKVDFRRHFPGYLMSVNPKIAGILPGLFSMNERVVYAGTWRHGFFSFTAVGATNVGSIRVYKDQELTTNNKPMEKEPVDLEMDLFWAKGEEVGEFRIGSTIVLLFEAPPDFEMNLPPNSKIKVGNQISQNY